LTQVNPIAQINYKKKKSGENKNGVEITLMYRDSHRGLSNCCMLHTVMVIIKNCDDENEKE
jgi:hypothetical protein